MNWRPVPVRGLGDVVAVAAAVTGAAAVARRVERVTGRPCGCDRRCEALNRVLPFGSPPDDQDVAEKPPPSA